MSRHPDKNTREHLEAIDEILRKSTDIESALKQVLQEIMAIYDCDRALLLFPCDPGASSWRITMQVARPQFDLCHIVNKEQPMTEDKAHLMRLALSNDLPEMVQFPSDHSQFEVKSALITTVHPKLKKPWLLGIHECRRPKTWSQEERVRLAEIGHRLADSLNLLLLLSDLKQNEERLSQLADASWEAIVIHENSRLIQANKQFYDLFEYSPQDLKDRPLQDYIIAPQSVKQTLNQLNENRVGPYETLGMKRDGTIFPMEVRVRLMDYHGVTVRVAAIRDITERKHRESLLKDIIQKYQTLFESAFDSILLMNGPGIIDCNIRSLALFGVEKKEDLVGHSIFKFQPPTQIENQSSTELFLERIEITLEGNAQRFLWKFLRPDGAPFDAEISLTPLEMENQTFLLAYISDITEKKATQDQLRNLRHLLSGIIDSMPSILIAVNLKGQITQWNQTAAQFTGLKAREAVGRPLLHAIPMLDNIMESILKAIKAGQAWSRDRIRLLQNDSSDLFDLTLYPLNTHISEKGFELQGAVVRLDNVTQKVRMEEMMIQSEKMLSVGGLAAGMAHEINNPLAGMLQNVQVMQNRLKSGMQKNQDVAQELGTSIDLIEQYMQKRGIFEMIDSVIESGHRAARIVTNMLNFSKKSASGHQKTDITHLLDETIELASNDYDLKKKFDFKSITIEKKYDPCPSIRCEPNMIKQVFLNLLKNGARVMAENMTASPAFIFKIYPNRHSVVIEIEDNGPGMDEMTRKRVFEPFYTTRHDGTGLGLSVSYFIITEHHKGSMRVESELNAGTRFIISLPIDSKISQ